MALEQNCTGVTGHQTIPRV